MTSFYKLELFGENGVTSMVQYIPENSNFDYSQKAWEPPLRIRGFRLSWQKPQEDDDQA